MSEFDNAALERRANLAAHRMTEHIRRRGYGLTACYSYADASGRPRFWVVRLDHPRAKAEPDNPNVRKKCLPLSFLGPGADDFSFRMPKEPAKGKRPVYRLIELLARADEPVWLVEGEKSADRLARLGLLAVTTAGGSQRSAETDYSPFSGRRVVIFRDNDDAGLKYAQDVTARLRLQRAEVEWIDLTELGLAEKQDVVDWLDAHEGATAGDLFALPRAEVSGPPKTVSTGNESHSAPTEPFTRRYSDIAPVPIRWLWPGKIARGKVTLIAGNPGLGKSQLTASIAATVTRGGTWPVSGGNSILGDALFVSAEDDAADTIRPRLDAAGADTARCHELRFKGFTLDSMGALEAAADEIGDSLALIVIDPITAYMGRADSHKNAEVRAVMAGLAEFASRRSAAIVCVTHLNKSSGTDALARVAGSLAYVAAARAVFLVAKAEEDESSRLFLPMKNNIGRDTEGLAFTVEGVNLPSGIETSRVRWEGTSVTITASELLVASQSGRDDAVSDAAEFLQTYLAHGPVLFKEVERDAKAAGHSYRTLERAKAKLKVISQKSSWSGGYLWRLPDTKSANMTDHRQEKMLAEMGTVGGPAADRSPATEESLLDEEIYGRGNWLTPNSEQRIQRPGRLWPTPSITLAFRRG